MSAALCERRCKYKKNLAKNVHRESLFLQKLHFFLNFSRFVLNFSSYNAVICTFDTHFGGKVSANRVQKTCFMQRCSLASLIRPQRYEKRMKHRSSISST